MPMFSDLMLSCVPVNSPSSHSGSPGACVVLPVWRSKYSNKHNTGGSAHGHGAQTGSGPGQGVDVSAPHRAHVPAWSSDTKGHQEKCGVQGALEKVTAPPGVLGGLSISDSPSWCPGNLRVSGSPSWGSRESQRK